MKVLAFAPWGFESPLPVVILGMIIGTTYGLLGVGLVLVYRTNRIINFAHGEVGAFGAALFAMAVTRWHVPYYAALPVAVVTAGATAALAEVAVVRRLRNAPRLMSIVATLGVAQFLVFFARALDPKADMFIDFPEPPGLPEFDLGGLSLTQAYVGMLVFGPLVALSLAAFLRRSRFGLALRCAAENPEAARMSGIFAARMSSLAWALAGAVSALTAVLVLPSRGFTTEASFGPGLLLRALAAAVVARMVSLPVALAAGIGLGVVEQLLLWNFPQGGLVQVALFVVILGALLLQRGIGGRRDERGSWAAVEGWRPVPEAIAALREVRALPWLLAVAGAVAGLVLPLLVDNRSASILTGIMAFAIVGVSVGVVTGLGGQLSLGQFAVGAVGAVASYHVSRRVGAFPLALLYAGVAGAAMSLLIGIPALRIRGLLLTVTTLGFALMASSWLLQQPWAFGGGVEPGRPIVFGNPLDTGKEYYYFVLAVLAVVLLLARNVRRGAVGRLLVAVRDNEDNARAFTVRARRVKIQGFLLAGFIAGVGGATYGHMLSRVDTAAFAVPTNIDVVAMTVIGGTSLLVGPLLGAFYIVGIPAFLPLDSAGLAATQLGWLLLILYLPGGLAQALEPLRSKFLAWAARRHQLAPDAEPAAVDAVVGTASLRVLGPTNGSRPRPRQGVLLEAVDLRKHFGGVAAVGGVSLHLSAGETVGLIGPNGAGKTTTFELLSGFTRPDAGRVFFAGEDVSALGPEDRASRGLVRSFQDAALFPTMTVLDAVALAFERVAPTSFVRGALGLRGPERRTDRAARELVGLMGLGRYRHSRIQELSTGTRRIVEIACLVALQPTVLLLDEPSSGVAQRETEALGRMLRDLRQQLDIALLVIEHDIPLVMGLSDRVIAMDSGRVLAEGPPEVVRTDPRVVESYLGGSIVAIERSDAEPPAPAGRRRRPAAVVANGRPVAPKETV